MLDPLEPVIRRLIEAWPQIKAPRVTEILRDDYGYAGSVDLVRKRLAVLRPRAVRPAQRTGYRAWAGAAAGLGRDADAAEDRRSRAPRLRSGGHAALFGGADRALQLRPHGRELFGGPRSHLRLAWRGRPRLCL